MYEVGPRWRRHRSRDRGRSPIGRPWAPRNPRHARHHQQGLHRHRLAREPDKRSSPRSMPSPPAQAGPSSLSRTSSRKCADKVAATAKARFARWCRAICARTHRTTPPLPTTTSCASTAASTVVGNALGLAGAEPAGRPLRADHGAPVPLLGAGAEVRRLRGCRSRTSTVTGTFTVASPAVTRERADLAPRDWENSRARTGALLGCRARDRPTCRTRSNGSVQMRADADRQGIYSTTTLPTMPTDPWCTQK